MYWLDIAVLAILALAAILGARTGCVGQLARLLALGSGLYGTIRLNDRVTPFVEEALPEVPVWATRALTYGAVFLAIYAGVMTVALFLNYGARAGQTRWLDRLLGAALGAGKAGLVLGFVLVALESYAPELGRETLEKSSLTPPLTTGTRRILDLIPQGCREGLQAQLRAALGSDVDEP